jgi:hypothetical protein
MQEFCENCARDGYERGRHVFFALHRGSPVGALIAETGSEGMNVFSLLNSCSIVFLAKSPECEWKALRALLVRAIDYYGGQGKGAFLFLGANGRKQEPHMQDLGLSYVAEGWRWLAARRVIPAYISYLEDLAIAGAARRQGERGKRPVGSATSAGADL